MSADLKLALNKFLWGDGFKFDRLFKKAILTGCNLAVLLILVASSYMMMIERIGADHARQAAGVAMGGYLAYFVWTMLCEVLFSIGDPAPEVSAEVRAEVVQAVTEALRQGQKTRIEIARWINKNKPGLLAKVMIDPIITDMLHEKKVERVRITNGKDWFHPYYYYLPVQAGQPTP